MRKCASFAEMNMILTIITKAKLLSFDSSNMRYPPSKFCNSYLLRNFTLNKVLSFLINRLCLSYFVFLFDFLIPMTTETTHNSCSFQIKCFIQILSMMLTEARVKNSLWTRLVIKRPTDSTTSTTSGQTDTTSGQTSTTSGRTSTTSGQTSTTSGQTSTTSDQACNTIT